MKTSRNYVLILLTLTASFNFVDRQILGVLLEPIGQEFQLPDSLLGLLSGIAFSLFYATLGIPIATLSDRFNRRNIIVLCTSIFRFMTALCGLAGSFLHLFLARIGVGIGEAGTAPASQSILSDLYDAHERPSAMAILGAGGNIGLMIGLLIGGWVNEWYGWRIAFFVASIPGLAIALLIAITVKEPSRKPKPLTTTLPRDTLEGIRIAIKIRSVRRFIMGGTLYAMTAYGIHTWMSVYFIRFHNMSTGEAGTVNAIIVGILGAIGAIAGGFLCSKLSKIDVRWNGWIPAIAIIVSLPFLVATLLSDNTSAAIGFFVVPGILSSIYAGPTYAIIQGLVPENRRAIAAALYLLVFNLIGLGLGPLATGILSDLYAPIVGAESLRWAMTSILVVSIPGCIFYMLGANSLKHDLRT